MNSLRWDARRRNRTPRRRGNMPDELEVNQMVARGAEMRELRGTCCESCGRPLEVWCEDCGCPVGCHDFTYPGDTKRLPYCMWDFGPCPSVDFPTRPATPSATGEHRPSRFSREVRPCMPGVSDRAEPRRISQWRCAECGLPLLHTASALRRDALSRRHTRPARPPVNVSPPPLRATAHDSGPVWVAGPSPYETFIRNTSPV